jgi:hypothetical protein
MLANPTGNEYGSRAQGPRSHGPDATAPRGDDPRNHKLTRPEVESPDSSSHPGSPTKSRAKLMEALIRLHRDHVIPHRVTARRAFPDRTTRVLLGLDRRLPRNATDYLYTVRRFYESAKADPWVRKRLRLHGIRPRDVQRALSAVDRAECFLRAPRRVLTVDLDGASTDLNQGRNAEA